MKYRDSSFGAISLSSTLPSFRFGGPRLYSTQRNTYRRYSAIQHTHFPKKQSHGSMRRIPGAHGPWQPTTDARLREKGLALCPFTYVTALLGKVCFTNIYQQVLAHIGPNNINSLLLVFLSSAVELLGAAAKHVWKPLLTRRSSVIGFYLQSRIIIIEFYDRGEML